MKLLFIICLGLVSWLCLPKPTSTITGQVNGWNYVCTLPDGYNSSNQYPVLFFFPGIGETGTNISKLYVHGPHSYPGIANDLPGWIVISLQPVNNYPSAAEMNLRINSLKQLYSIDTMRINYTGLSHGGWCCITLVQNGNSNPRSVITVQGVQPGNTTDFYPDTLALQNFTAPYLCFEQNNDYRAGDVIVNYLNSKRPGQAQFIQTFYGNGVHGYFAFYYGNAATTPDYYSNLGSITIYQWLININNNTVLDLPTAPLVQQAAIKKFYFNNNTIYYKASMAGDYAVTDIAGRIVITGKYKPGNNNISIAYLPVGMYFFKTYFTTKKIVKL